MQSFEQIRSHVSNLHTLRTNDPYLISFDLTLADDRHQGIYLAEMEGDDGLKYLRVSTPIGPATGVNATTTFSTNGNYELLHERFAAVSKDPALLGLLQLGTAHRLPRDQRSRRVAVPSSDRKPPLLSAAG